MKLYAHQERVVSDARSAFLSGHRRIVIVSPTGSGKTAIGSAIAQSAIAKGSQVLWLAHRRELISQASERLDAIGCNDHGVVLAGTQRVRPGAALQVASVQTLTVRGERPPADIIVWDECHHCAALTYKAIAAAYPNAVHIGLTATPERSDGAALGDAFDTIVTGPTIKELTALNYLVPCDVWAPSENDKTLADEPVRAWHKVAMGRPTICFATNIPHSQETVRRFIESGVPAVHVDGDTKTADREAAVARFVSGETLVMSNVYVFTEGFDAPRAEVCLLARGASHPSTYLQMIGRVLRPFPGKERALLIDLRGVVHDHGMPDDDRTYSLDGDAIRRASDQIRQCPLCGSVSRPGPQCGRCGYIFAAPELPSVVERPLVRILRPEATFDEKQRTFDRLCKVARLRGYKPGWLGHRFKATYGHWPVGLHETVAEEIVA